MAGETELPIIPDHEMVRCVGRGSYGEVWLARSATGQYRGVKIVRRKTFSETRPFDREFLGLQKFEPVSRTHPGVVAVLHVGRNEPAGYFYYVMEVADDLESGQRINAANYTPRTLSTELERHEKLPLPERLARQAKLTRVARFAAGGRNGMRRLRGR